MTRPQEPDEDGLAEEEKVRTTVTLPRSMYRRIRRSMSINKRTFSGEIEFAMEGHLQEVEQRYGLTTKHLRDDWPE